MRQLAAEANQSPRGPLSLANVIDILLERLQALRSPEGGPIVAAVHGSSPAMFGLVSLDFALPRSTPRPTAVRGGYAWWTCPSSWPSWLSWGPLHTHELWATSDVHIEALLVWKLIYTWCTFQDGPFETNR